MSERRGYGLTLVTVAALLWSTAGLFVRMVEVSVWDLILWRSVFAGGALLLIMMIRPRQGAGAFGWPGLGASMLAAVTMFSYMASLTLTTVANVMVIYATLPLVTAGLALALVGERSSRRALVAGGVSLIGVTIVAGLSLSPADIAGNGLAFIMTASFAALLVLTRRFPQTDVVLVNALGAFLCALAALPLSSGTPPAPQDMMFLTCLGVMTTAFSFLLFLIGGRHVPSTEAALIGLLDVILGPLWVWIAFAEHPGHGALVGGGGVLLAVAWYLLQAPRNQPRAVQRPTRLC